MNDFEKAEKLRTVANVSFEEAKTAIDACNGDLLDAMIYLEKQGKVASGETATKSTRPEDNLAPSAIVAGNTNESNSSSNESKKTKGEGGDKFKEFCKTAWQKGCDNNFVMERQGKKIIDIPVWVFVIILICSLNFVLPIMLVSLFFGCKYSFEGKDDLSKINDVINQAGNACDDVADRIKNEFIKEK